MIDDFSPSDLERLRGLLAEKALFGLDPDDAAEAERLLKLHGDADAEEFERLAAALAVASARSDEEPMPEHLRRRIAEQARPGPTTTPLAPAPPAPRPRPASPAWSGWAAAAACLLLAVAAWLRPTPPARLPSPAEARLELLQLPDARTTPLAAAAPGSPARGDLVWSGSRQGGFMRLEGLPANDPRRMQYQLWIFDRAQDERHPIDGGVFDVTGGEVVVPIRAPIRVVEPYMFAVTAEKPGGVVVSRRDPVVLLGKVEDAQGERH